MVNIYPGRITLVDLPNGGLFMVIYPGIESKYLTKSSGSRVSSFHVAIEDGKGRIFMKIHLLDRF